jgi:hypothetical protein
VGGFTAGQFALYGDIKKALGKCTLLGLTRSLGYIKLTFLSLGATNGVEIAK